MRAKRHDSSARRWRLVASVRRSCLTPLYDVVGRCPAASFTAVDRPVGADRQNDRAAVAVAVYSHNPRAGTRDESSAIDAFTHLRLMLHQEQCGETSARMRPPTQLWTTRPCYLGQGRTQEGADGAEAPPPEMLNILGVFSCLV